MKIQRTNLTSLEPEQERSSPYCKVSEIPCLMRCGFLTMDPFVGISVFIAKLSKRQYCWRVFEDFHSQEFVQLFDIHCRLFMRLHFSIGGYDYRRTARFRQSIHFSITQVLFADHVHRRTGVHNKVSFLWFLRVDAGRHLFPKVRRMLPCFSPSILEHVWPASTLLHGHLALATLSLPETDPQILEHWGYSHEVHLGKSFRAKEFGLECMRDVQRLSVRLMKTSAASCLKDATQSSCIR